MIHFPATVEIFLCLVAGILVGWVAGWLTGSFLIAVVVCVGVMCLLIDALFSYSMEDDGEWDD